MVLTYAKRFLRDYVVWLRLMTIDDDNELSLFHLKARKWRKSSKWEIKVRNLQSLKYGFLF